MKVYFNNNEHRHQYDYGGRQLYQYNEDGLNFDLYSMDTKKTWKQSEAVNLKT